MKMVSLREFIEKHIVTSNGKPIKLSKVQLSLLDFLEKNKGKNIILFRSRSGQYNFLHKKFKEWIESNS